MDKNVIAAASSAQGPRPLKRLKRSMPRAESLSEQAENITSRMARHSF